MILVTVGTTMPFDELLAEVDRLAADGFFDEEVTTQFGQSSYRMAGGMQFMARPSIDDLIEESSIVITHGGATVLQLLLLRKPFVAFPNPRGAGDHQTKFLGQVAEVLDISWSKDVRDLARLFAERRESGPVQLGGSSLPQASAVIRELL